MSVQQKKLDPMATINKINSYEKELFKEVPKLLENKKQELLRAFKVLDDRRESMKKIVQDRDELNKQLKETALAIEEQTRKMSQKSKTSATKAAEEVESIEKKVSLEVDTSKEAISIESPIEKPVDNDVVTNIVDIDNNVAIPMVEGTTTETQVVISKEKEIAKKEPTVNSIETKEPATVDAAKPEVKPFTHSVFANVGAKKTFEVPKVRTFIPKEEPPRAPKRPIGFNNTRPDGRPDNRPPYVNNTNSSNPSNFRNNNQNLNKFGDKRVGSAPVLPSTLVASKDKKKTTDKPTKVFEEKKSLSKKTLTKKGFVTDNSSLIEYDEISGEITKIRTRKISSEKKKSQFNQPQQLSIETAIVTSANITVKVLSEKIGKTGAEIIKKLFLLNIIKTINDPIDFDTAELVASEFNVKLEKQVEMTKEELIASFIETEDENSKDIMSRPPIVTIMGHVDHGKTSILDYIRKATVAKGEAGGITQHIGAYTITLNNQLITFLDTPGHEAFTSMRARGANVTDIVVIVVAADDGIMPQTIEAINHAKAAKTPIIIAVNKMDKTDADADRILQQLSNYGIVPEDWGGETPVCRVSAKTGEGIESLLENILTTAEVMELKANPKRNANGTVIEAKLDKGKGPVASILVQNGTLKISNFIVAGTTLGRIRAMFDDKGKPVVKAGPSIAVSILGLQDVPNAGDQIVVVSDEKLAKEVLAERLAKEKQDMVTINKVTLDDVFGRIADGKLKDLNIIIKADVQGSAEAISQSLARLSNEEVKVNIVHSGAGAISESDVMLADTTNSVIIGFNVRPDSKARQVADKLSIDIRNYSIIYDAINDIELAIKGMLTPKYKEVYLGKAEVRQIFKITGVGLIAGSMVKDGKLTRHCKIKLSRDGKVIFEGKLTSLKRIKEDVKEVATGYECGIGIDGAVDIKEGDIVEAYSEVLI